MVAPGQSKPIVQGVSFELKAGQGLAGLALGGNFLDYFVLGADPVTGQLRGIFWVEAGVGITVAGVMLKLFTMFAARGRGAGK